MKWLYYFSLIFILVINCYTQDRSNEFINSNNYISAINENLKSLNKTITLFIEKLKSTFPKVDGFNFENTYKVYYSVLNENGNEDYFIIISGYYRGDNNRFNFIIDTSVNNTERIYNLIKSIEYLSSREKYVSGVVKIDGIEYQYVKEDKVYYIPVVISEKDLIVDKGFIIKIDFDNVANSDKILEKIVQNLKVKELINYNK